MNNTIVNNQQNLNQEEYRQISFFNRSFNFLGMSIPFWLISLCLLIIILLVIFGLPDSTPTTYTTYREVYPDYDFNIATDSPTNTAIDNILNRRY